MVIMAIFSTISILKEVYFLLYRKYYAIGAVGESLCLEILG